MTYTETEAGWRTPNGNPIAFRFREDTNDWNTISACTTEDEYGLRGHPISGRVLDVGGYLGSVGITIAVDNPDAQVTIVEPVPSNAALIRHNAERNGVSDRVTLIEGAVGKGGESVEVWFGYRGNVSAEHHAFVGNSSLAYDHGGALDHDTVTYKARSLASLVGDGLAFLKIDCEGGEWAFLKGPALARIDRIVGEAHSVRGHTGGDIVALLAETHEVTLTGDPGATCGFTAVRR